MRKKRQIQQIHEIPRQINHCCSRGKLHPSYPVTSQELQIETDTKLNMINGLLFIKAARGMDASVLGTAPSIHPAVDSTTNGDKFKTKFAEQIH